MKSTIYTRLSVIAIAGVLAACSAASPDDKKAQLEKLKTQQVEITKQIQQLEAEIAKANPDSTATAVKSKEVSVTELAPRKFDHYVQTQGSIDAEDNIMVSSKSMGVVMAVYVKEGQQVSKGQVLAQIDNSVLVRNIEAQKSQLELAKTVFERQKNLWDQKIGTEVQYLQAKTNKESLEKQIESLQEQNDMTRIKAPISGTVDQVDIKIGENIAPGQPAVRVVNTSDLKLVSSVSEAYVTNIRKGNKAVVHIPELKEDITAVVTFVGKTIDPLSRTFPVEVKLPSNADLRPNMTGILKVIFHTEPSTLVVPVNVVQEVNKEKIVFVAVTEGKQTVARKKVVTVEGVYDNLAQVKGLETGDKVITFGYQGLNDGQVIKI
ncbi:MAG TPA: efflux RND transporter periplasmic adaptor subunit [Ohtaekwangia sp.]|uniref:efflux RND transporter periplasmic adaptor subunit n=1 Tax=Ohtaekwangia sp. TaxID=2066019 RepID=UPI002F933BAD